MKFFKYIAVGAIALSMGVTTSCVDDLNVTPDNPNTLTELTTAEQWYGYFGSLYSGFLYVGNVSTSDYGAGTWMRCHWNLQEITADEAIISNKWNDPGYQALNFNTTLTNNEWVYAAFTREFYTAKQCSEFISKIDGAAAAGVPADEIRAMKAEARVIRAYAYYYMIDLFGRGPWVADTPTGATPPTYDRSQLFNAVTADLQDVISSPDLRPAAQQVYGRVSKEAARMVLAKLFLNAEVYIGQNMYAQCAQQCKEITKTINSLAPEYKYLFCSSNHKYVGNNEIIWAIPQQVAALETWGGTTYMTAGAFIETADPFELAKLGCGYVSYDVSKGQPVLVGPDVWSGLRMRPELSQMLIQNGGKRNLVYRGEFKIGVEDLDHYDKESDGYMCVKYTYTTEDNYENNGCDAPYYLDRYYLVATSETVSEADRLAAAKNVIADYPEFAGFTPEEIMKNTDDVKMVYGNMKGEMTKDVTLGSQICNADFPVFRLADVYLMLSECQFRGVPDADPGFVLFNNVRGRAGLPENNNPSELDILNERQCELYWEGHRRSDLIRFGRYTGGAYNWSWKGGIYEGTYLPASRNLFAIPYQYVVTVGQNPGY